MTPQVTKNNSLLDSIQSKRNRDVITLAVQGMYCAGCASRIENVLKKTDGIEEAKVNFATSTAIIKYNNLIDYNTIINKIKKLGYDANIKENIFAKERILKIQKENKKTKKEIILFVFSFLLSIPLVIPMIFQIQIPKFIQFILATPIQFISGFRFHKGAIKTILTGGANMDVLVSLGTNVAYFYSTLVLFFPELFLDKHLYFESSAVVITFVLLGKILEQITKRKANQAIEDLFSLQPLTCHLIKFKRKENQNNLEIKEQSYIDLNNERSEEIIEEILDIDIHHVQIDDILLIRPGENVPTDGIVMDGFSEVNESLVTGESLPVKKKKNDLVYSGTMNLSGMLKIKVTKTPEESTLANILKMVEKAQNSKAPVQKMADLVSGYFAYGVIIISILNFIFSYLFWGIDFSSSLIRSVSILVIACPCALGLATPIAILIASGIAAKYGILFRNAESIENIGKIQSFIFDKTGTLTSGQLKVIKSYFDGNYQSQTIKDIYSMIYLLENASEHVIGKSIVQYIKSNFSDIPGSNFTLINSINYPGYGIKGEILEKSTNTVYEVYIGNYEFFSEKWNIVLNFDIHDIDINKTIVYTYIPNFTKGYLILEDTLKEEANFLIETLRYYHIQPILATGDKKEIALKIANHLGIEKVYYELKPEDKLSLIEELQNQKQIIAMIGDGINDAPALSKADVSFAIGDVSLTKESADVNLIHNDLINVLFSIELSRKTLRKIKQNLFFAFIYNIIGIPLAAMGYLNPMFAGFAMAMSSVSVVTSSLFLYFVSKERYINKIKQLNIKV